MSTVPAQKRIEPSVNRSSYRQLTLDDAIAAAHKETGVSYSKDDPVLAVVAILNRFAAGLQDLFEDERNKFSAHFIGDVAGVSDTFDHKVEDVATSMRQIAETIGNESIQTVISAVAQQAVEGDKIRRTIRKSFVATSVLVAFQWLAVAAFYLVLK